MSAVPKDGNTNSVTSLEAIKKTTTATTKTSLEGVDEMNSSKSLEPAAVKKESGKNGCNAAPTTESTMV